jgi:hypothetical protein
MSIIISAKMLDLKNLTINNTIWFWIAIVEFGIILLLVIISNRKNFKNSKFKKEKDSILNEEIDFGNIINSSFNSKVIYDELIRKCHPDRFVQNVELNKIAISLSQEITENKNDIKRLEELKELAIKQLNINL